MYENDVDVNDVDEMMDDVDEHHTVMMIPYHDDVAEIDADDEGGQNPKHVQPCPGPRI